MAPGEIVVEIVTGGAKGIEKNVLERNRGMDNV